MMVTDEKFGQVCGVLGVAALVMGLLIVAFFSGPPGYTGYADDCRVYTISWSGLRACYDDGNCNLSDDEMFAMYKANKNALMSCQMRNVSEAIIKKDALDALANELVKELQKEEPAKAEPEERSKFSRPTEESFSASS